jgi:hypothetical protein
LELIAAAVDGELDAGDVGGIVGGEESHIRTMTGFPIRICCAAGAD